ncbi:MAG: ABC transporter ATP-binding protein [Oscillospiraceae bacterium]
MSGKQNFVKRFFEYYKPYKGLFVADIVAAFFISMCDLVYPLITRTVINDLVPNRLLRTFFVYAALLVIIYLIKLALNYFVMYYGHILGVRMQGDMRREIFGHLQKLPFAYFDEHKSGSLMSRVVNDLQDISELAHHGPEDFLISILMMIGSFAILCTVNLSLTLIVFAFLPLFLWFMIKMQGKMGEGFSRAREKTSEINAELGNSLSGIRVSKAFDNRCGEMKKFDRAVDGYIDARSSAYRVMAQFYSGMYFMLDFMYLVVLVAAGLYFYFGYINIGDYAAYFLYIGQFIQPIKRFMQFCELFEDGKTGFKRFCEIMDTKPEEDNRDSKEENDLSGDIVFDNVSFTYDKEQKVLDHLNMTIENGKKTALVGPSGGGKTTLCHLIPRFYDIEAGKITIGGMDIEKITRGSLRRGIGIVQQEVFLFTGTISENIAYACENATENDIIEAAKKARIHDLIMEMENGYDTYVGERGVKLSGGQKQRIAIARIFLKNPQILILDEATSALDNITEHLLQQSLDELCRGRTTIVVAHRLSTVRNADEIIVLTDDGIAEQGTHQELMLKNGVYKEIYNTQFL